MQRLLSHAEASDAWIGQAATLTSGLDPDSGAELLYQLADGYRRAGKMILAADTLYLLARRYTDHPLADSAMVWLLRYYASAETAHAAPGSAVPIGGPLANVASNGASTPPNLPQTGDGALSRDERLERASQLGKYLEQARPALFADPAVRFPIAATQRALGFTASAEKYTVVLTKQAVAPAWRRCAEAERWIAGDNRLPPAKPIATCSRIGVRPLLDGKHDEPFWRQAEPLRLGSDRETDGAVVKLARDDAFFYLAIDCPLRSAANVELTDAPRPRDGDLSAHDRVTLRFDVDRDYTTAFEMTIDARGWTNDRCWGDAHWNPQWFVAAGRDGNRWTAEAAVPLAELSPRQVPVKSAWALSAVRQSPGTPPESWIGSADTQSPDRYGLLLFE